MARVIIIAVAVFLAVIASGCGGSGSPLPVGQTWDVGLAANNQTDEDGVMYTLYTITVHENQCTHENSHGVPVPDRVEVHISYPSGDGNLYVSPDLEQAVRQGEYIVMQVGFAGPEGMQHTAQAFVTYGGTTVHSLPVTTS
jgi:hypothetical protein